MPSKHGPLHGYGQGKIYVIQDMQATTDTQIQREP